jgi:hypothetical protein
LGFCHLQLKVLTNIGAIKLQKEKTIIISI